MSEPTPFPGKLRVVVPREPGRPPPPHPTTVAQLTFLLGRAKSGHLRAMVFGTIEWDPELSNYPASPYEVKTGWSASLDDERGYMTQLLGAGALAVHRLSNEITSGYESIDVPTPPIEDGPA